MNDPPDFLRIEAQARYNTRKRDEYAALAAQATSEGKHKVAKWWANQQRRHERRLEELQHEPG